MSKYSPKDVSAFSSDFTANAAHSSPLSLHGKGLACYSSFNLLDHFSRFFRHARLAFDENQCLLLCATTKCINITNGVPLTAKEKAKPCEKLVERSGNES